MSEELSRFDAWIDEGGPSAFVLKEYLEPVAGRDDVIFPPTYAPPEDKKGTPSGYVIDGEGENSVCLIDSVGSQANRLEPLFKKAEFRDLVPQIEIQVGGRLVNLLDVGHRAADAFARSTPLAGELQAAFAEWRANGNATLLAKIAPTSLVFGAWDSRGSQAKVPRVIGSTIRAFRVEKLSRAAQYNPSLENEEVAQLLETDVQKQHKVLSKAGFLDAPSGRTHGGVIVRGDIIRTTIVNLTALRSLGAASAEAQRVLQRYILGLCLVVTGSPVELFLRQGCLLVKAERPPESTLVHRDGRREPFQLALGAVLSFAKSAARAFGLGLDRVVEFDPKAAKELVKKASKVKEES
jgi:CRISPR-associated protein Csb1